MSEERDRGVIDNAPWVIDNVTRGIDNVTRVINHVTQVINHVALDANTHARKHTYKANI